MSYAQTLSRNPTIPSVIHMTYRAALIAFSLCAAATTAHARLKTKVVQYGPHARHWFRIQYEASGQPRPANVHFHGGGFTSGAPTYGPLASQLRRGKVTLVGATYRFLGDGVTKLEVQQDGARVVQYLRLHAGEFNVDPERISVSGYSAGGVIAAWVALHDDIADPASEDPVLRQSSRVKLCWLQKAQVHPVYIADWVKYTPWNRSKLLPTIFAYIKQNLFGDGFAAPFTREDFATRSQYQQARRAYREQTFAFYQATADDPPVGFLENQSDNPLRYLKKIVPGNWGGLLHSPLLMIPLQRRLQENGVETLWGKSSQLKSFLLTNL